MSEAKIKEHYLVTSALPYANGELHIGHIAGAYLPADIFVRYQKLKGNDVLYICGTDEYGAPISIKSEAEGISPRTLVEKYHKIQKKSFAELEIDFDNFSGTARPEHNKLAQEFFLNLFDKGYVNKKNPSNFTVKMTNGFFRIDLWKASAPFVEQKEQEVTNVKAAENS